MTIIRRGGTRTVVLVRGWAIKVPSCRNGLTAFLHGWVNNRMERERWGWCWGAAPELLCPVLGSCLAGFVLVMERAEEVDEEDLLPSEIDRLKTLTNDVHVGNVGRLSGRLVLVDYP